MKIRPGTFKVLCGALLAFAAAGCGTQAGTAEAAPASAVQLVRVPEGGIQPQIVVRGDVIHQIYFKGEARGGDAFYVRSQDGGATWSTPLRVNSQPGSAVASGTIRGPKLAVGKEGRIHVAWNGSGLAEPKINGSAPMLYARLKDDGSGFEEQRNLMTDGFVLDGGGSVAADEEGRVYVAWHAGTTKDGDEETRRVFIRFSEDEGRTWSAQKPVWDVPTAVCACCQVGIMAEAGGKVFLTYRAATKMVNRDTYLLQSRDGGQTFEGVKLHSWRVGMCPMSSYALTRNGDEVLAAWESEKQVFFSPLNDKGEATAIQATPSRGNNQKHPVLAVNARGETLLVWTEGTGWARGGKLRWQLYNAQGQAVPDAGGEAPGIPVWSFASAWAQPDGSFTIVH